MCDNGWAVRAEGGDMPRCRETGEAVGEGQVAKDGGMEVLWQVGKCLVGRGGLHKEYRVESETVAIGKMKLY